MNLIIGCDHAGFELKEELKKKLSEKGYSLKDSGTYSAESVDYPDFAHAVASGVASGEYERGILICGSANGVAMTANKHKDIRAAVCWNEEIARLARQHNNANILCIPARFVSNAMAEKMTEVFLSSGFEGGRHQKRIEKINC
jgi:ribose 5-phosphate isomerase B